MENIVAQLRIKIKKFTVKELKKEILKVKKDFQVSKLKRAHVETVILNNPWYFKHLLNKIGGKKTTKKAKPKAITYIPQAKPKAIPQAKPQAIPQAIPQARRIPTRRYRPINKPGAVLQAMLQDKPKVRHKTIPLNVDDQKILTYNDIDGILDTVDQMVTNPKVLVAFYDEINNTVLQKYQNHYIIRDKLNNILLNTQDREKVKNYLFNLIY